MKEVFEEYPIISNNNILLKKVTIDDFDHINELKNNERVYKYVPTFVPEMQNNTEFFINNICDELFNNKIEIILGIYYKKELCGLFEIYHYDKDKNQVTIGFRINKEFWNKGISSKSISLVIDYLFNKTNIKTICASTMVINKSSERCLEKNNFLKYKENILEDWGYDKMVVVNKWILNKKD